MLRCKNCHNTILFSSVNDYCGCEEMKAWNVSRGETEEDSKSYFASYPDDLAKDIAEKAYNDDPCSPGEFRKVVCVRDLKGCLHTYEITAEVEISFHASEIKHE